MSARQVCALRESHVLRPGCGGWKAWISFQFLRVGLFSGGVPTHPPSFRDRLCQDKQFRLGFWLVLLLLEAWHMPLRFVSTSIALRPLQRSFVRALEFCAISERTELAAVLSVLIVHKACLTHTCTCVHVHVVIRALASCCHPWVNVRGILG